MCITKPSYGIVVTKIPSCSSDYPIKPGIFISYFWRCIRDIDMQLNTVGLLNDMYVYIAETTTIIDSTAAASLLHSPMLDCLRYGLLSCYVRT